MFLAVDEIWLVFNSMRSCFYTVGENGMIVVKFVTVPGEGILACNTLQDLKNLQNNG